MGKIIRGVSQGLILGLLILFIFIDHYTLGIDNDADLKMILLPETLFEPCKKIKKKLFFTSYSRH